MNELTPSEIRVLTLLAHGYTKAEIAKLMKVRPDTMRYYLMLAKRKLGANMSQRDNAHVVYLAMKAGLID